MADFSPTNKFRSDTKSHKQIGLMLVILSVSAAILGVIIFREWGVLVSYPWELHPLPLLTSFGLYTLDLLLVIWVWADMMAKMGYPMSYRKHFQYFSIANLAKRLPGTVWYIAGRAQFYKEDGVPLRITSAASAVEMGVMVIAGIFVSLIFGLSIFLNYQINLWIVGGIFLGSIMVLHPRILNFAMNKLGVNVNVFGYKNLLLWAGVYSLVWIGGGGMLFFICQVIVPVNFSSIGYLIGCWTLVGLLGVILFFSPSNLGVSEIGFSLLLSSVMPSPIAVIVALAVRVFTLLFELVWALVSMGLKKKRVIP